MYVNIIISTLLQTLYKIETTRDFTRLYYNQNYKLRLC